MAYLLVGGFMLCDIISGSINAIKLKIFTSSVMREGLFHKLGSILGIAFSTLIDYTQTYLDLGVAIPLTNTVCVYIILMECASIFENICSINPDLFSEELKSHFLKLTKKGD